jgi:hypothetical protein
MKRRSKGGYTGLFQYIGGAFRRVGEESCAGDTDKPLLSGSKPKAPGFAGGYLLNNHASCMLCMGLILNFARSPPPGVPSSILASNIFGSADFKRGNLETESKAHPQSASGDSSVLSPTCQVD